MAERCSCCRRWEEHSYLNWPKRRHKFHFFKVLLGDFSHQLSIPKKFVILFQEKLPETVELEDPTGKIWHVKQKKTDGHIFFCDGWEEFVRDHSLEVGDFLVFRFNGSSCFKVLMFDTSACEKEILYSCNKKKKGISCDENPVKEEGRENSAEIQLVSIPTRAIGFSNAEVALPQETNLKPCQGCSKMVSKVQKEEKNFHEDVQEAPKQPICRRVLRSWDGMVYPEEQERLTYLKGKGRGRHFSIRADYTANKSTEDTSVKADPGETANSSRKMKCVKPYSQQFISNRRHVTEEEKKRVFLLASAVQSTRPAFMSIMKPSHVYRRFFLTVPIEFASKFFHNRTHKIILHNTVGEWEVHCTQYNRVHRICFGWKEFVIGNNLEEGDVLIFEFAGRRSHERMNVSIFRVVEDAVQPTAVGIPQRRGRKRWSPCK